MSCLILKGCIVQIINLDPLKLGRPVEIKPSNFQQDVQYFCPILKPNFGHDRKWMATQKSVSLKGGKEESDLQKIPFSFEGIVVEQRFYTVQLRQLCCSKPPVATSSPILKSQALVLNDKMNSWECKGSKLIFLQFLLIFLITRNFQSE